MTAIFRYIIVGLRAISSFEWIYDAYTWIIHLKVISAHIFELFQESAATWILPQKFFSRVLAIIEERYLECLLFEYLKITFFQLDSVAYQLTLPS